MQKSFYHQKNDSDQLILKLQRSLSGQDTFSKFTGSYGAMTTLMSYLGELQSIKLQ